MSGNSNYTTNSGNGTLHRIFIFFLLIGCIYLSLFIGTQYIAANTGRDGIYRPYMGLVWAMEALVNGEDLSVYVAGLKISAIVALVSILMVQIMKIFLHRRSNKIDLKGLKAWADTEDMKSLLNRDEGLYIGMWGNDYLREPSDEHAIVIAPTGSGKSTGYAIPNLLSHEGPAIVVDIKGELYKKTSGYRKNVLKQKIFALDFTCSDMVLEKGEVEEHGLDWKDFSGRIIKAGWGENIDDDQIKVTQDPSVINRGAHTVFGKDAGKIHEILRQPHRGSCARFNPLEEVRMGLQEVRDVQNIIETLIDPQGEGNPDHWHRLAKSVASGLTLHTLYARQDKSLGGMTDLASDPDRQMHEVFNSMLQTDHDPDGKQCWFDFSKMRFTKTHPVVAHIAREMKDKEYEELSGIKSTMMGFLALFRDPLIRRNTSCSDFRISDITEPAYPGTLYIIVPPSDLHRLMPLVRLVLNMINIRLMENRNLVQYEMAREQVQGLYKAILSLIPGSKGLKGQETQEAVSKRRQKVLMVLDEFPAFGRMDIQKKSLSYWRGYGIRALVICQDLDQIYENYGKNCSLLGQFKIRIYHATNSDLTAKQISADAGETYEESHSVSYSDNSNGHVSHSISRSKIPLVSYDEAKMLPDTDAVIFTESQKPIYATKIVYYKDQWFSRMSQIPPVAVSDRVPHESEFAALTNVMEHKKIFIDESYARAVLKAKIEKRGISEEESLKMASNSIDFRKSDSF